MVVQLGPEGLRWPWRNVDGFEWYLNSRINRTLYWILLSYLWIGLFPWRQKSVSYLFLDSTYLTAVLAFGRRWLLNLQNWFAYREQRFEEIQPNRCILKQKEGASLTLLDSSWGGQTELGTPEVRAWAQHGDTKGNSISPLPLPDDTGIEPLPSVAEMESYAHFPNGLGR